MATTAKDQTRKLEDFVTSYVSLLKQTESNQIALGREACAAREYCRVHKISFLKFCEACNMPRSTVYYHIGTYKAYTWLHEEKGVSKRALGTMPAGSVIQLQELLAKDPEGAEEFVQELMSTDKAREKLKIVGDEEAQEVANDELKKREAKMREELAQQWKSKVAAAKRGAKAEIEHLQEEVNTAQKDATDAAKRVLELEQDVDKRIEKAAKSQAKSQAAKSPDAEKLKELRKNVKQLKGALSERETHVSELSEALQAAQAKESAAIDEKARDLANDELRELVGTQLADVSHTMRETRLTVSAVLGDKPKVRHKLMDGAIAQFEQEIHEWREMLDEWAVPPKPKKKAAKKRGKK